MSSTTTNRKRPTGPRRSKGEGGLSKVVRHDGSIVWRASRLVELVQGTKSVRITADGATKAEAMDRLQRNITKRQVRAGTLPASVLKPAKGTEIETVASVAAKWLATKRKITHGTLKQYEAFVRLHLVPALGEVPIRLLSPEQCLEFVETTLPNKRKPNGDPVMGPTAIRGGYFILKSVIDYALDRDFIVRNPLRTITPPERAETSQAHKDLILGLQNWAPEHIATHIRGQENEARWLLALFELRQAEALGITTDGVKLYGGAKKNKSVVLVQGQLKHQGYSHGCEADPKTGKWRCGRQADHCPSRTGQSRFYLSKTKTKDPRFIPAVEPLYSALKAHQKRREEWAKQPEWEPLKGLENLFFTTPTGKPIRHQDDRRAWKKLLKECGITGDLRLHDARHIAATKVMASGHFTEQQQMAIGGWKTKTMLDNYAAPSVPWLYEATAEYGSMLMARYEENKPITNSNRRAKRAADKAAAEVVEERLNKNR